MPHYVNTSKDVRIDIIKLVLEADKTIREGGKVPSITMDAYLVEESDIQRKQ
jgi:hypothetical protein